MKRICEITKAICSALYLVFGSAWILLTSKAERRQLDYDLGYGEIE